MDKSVLDLLKEMRYGTMNISEPKKKRKLEVIPGRSIGTDSGDYVETEDESLRATKKGRQTIEKKKKTINNTEEKENKKIKGKGKGKKSKIQDQKIKEKENKKQVVFNQYPLQNTSLKATDGLNCLTKDFIDTMPIIFEDNLLCGDEIVLVKT